MEKPKNYLNWNYKNISRCKTTDDVCISTIKDEIHRAIGTEICSLNDFICDNPVIPNPAFLTRFYRRNLIPLYMTATFMIILTAYIFLGISFNQSNMVTVQKVSSTHYSGFIVPEHDPVLHK